MTAPANWRLWLRAAALCVLLLAFVIPPVIIDRPVRDVVAVLDITGSMNVRDQHLDGVAVSRIAMEKRTVRRLLAALPCGSRLGLAVFVEGQPFLLFQPTETCASYPALNDEISAIDWRMGWDSESHIAESLLASIRMAASLRADLVFMTDGQETPPLAWSGAPDFSRVRGTVHGLVVGVGGHDFVPIPKYDPNGREIGVFKPGDVPSEKSGLFRGREHLSAVDEPHLQALSAQSGLAYRHLDGPDSIYAPLVQASVARQQPTRTALDWLPALCALILLGAAFGRNIFFLKDYDKISQVLQRTGAFRREKHGN